MSNDVASLDAALGKAAKLHRVLREAGLTDKALQMPIDDLKMRQRLVDFWNAGGRKPTTTYERAREIMNPNFIGPSEINWRLHILDYPPSSEGIPFTEAELREAENTHILIAVSSISILRFRGSGRGDLFHRGDWSDRKWDWYDTEIFARKTGREASWRLVRKVPVDDSTNMPWSNQRWLLAKNEEVPTARVLAYTAIAHYLLTHERLFERHYVRCSDVDSQGRRVTIGFGESGLRIHSDWGDRDSLCGIASAQKSN